MTSYSVRFLAVFALVFAMVPSFSTSPAGALDPTEASFSGTLTDDAGRPLSGYVNVHEPGEFHPVARADVLPDGTYRIDGVAAGAYEVFFGSYDQDAAQLGEWWPDHPEYDRGTEVVVGPGEERVLDASLDRPSSITGRLLGPEGEPVEGYVAAYRQVGDAWLQVGSAYVTAGDYVLDRLYAADHRLEFAAHDADLISEFYRDAPTVEEGEDIAVPRQGAREGIDAVLARRGGISGRVLGPDGAPVQYALVEPYRRVGEKWQGGLGVSTAADGTYLLSGLVTGTYRVRFSGSGAGLATEYFDDVPRIEQAEDITVAPDTIVGAVDARLVRQGRIAGTVSDPRGDPLVDVIVNVWSEEGSLVSRSMTDSEGRYQGQPLEPGENYTVQFIGGPYSVPTYFGGTREPESAGSVSVTDDTTTRADIVLADAGVITGTAGVRDDFGIRRLSVEIDVFERSGDTWRELPEAYSVSTDEGRYTLPNLPEGRYRLRYTARASAEGWVDTEFWKDAASLGSAQDVVVRGRTTVSRIDPVLAYSYPIRGTRRPEISGTAHVGRRLAVDLGEWSDPRPSNFAIQWYADDRAIVGATSYLYDVSPSDRGRRISATVLASCDCSGRALQVSEPTRRVPLGRIGATKPLVSGQARVGRMVRATRTRTDVDARLSYRWLRDGRPIRGARARSYRLSAPDRGSRVKVRVTFRAPGHRTERRASRPIRVRGR